MKKVRKHLSLFLAAAMLLSTVFLPINSFASSAKKDITIENQIDNSTNKIEKYSVPGAESPAKTETNELNNETVSDFEETVPGSDENASGFAETVPNSDETVSGSEETIPGSDETVPGSIRSSDDILPGRVIVTLKQNSAAKYKAAPFSENNEAAVLNSSIFDNIDIADIDLISPASEEDEIMTLSDDDSDSPGDIFLIELNNQSEQGVFDAIKQLQANEDVLWAEPDYLRELCDTIPNDEFYSELWGMEMINAPKVWDKFTGSPDVVVGDYRRRR